jgi:ketosteroid isomerase-like protein
VTTPMAWLLELRDGKIVRGRDFLDQQEALEAG